MAKYSIDDAINEYGRQDLAPTIHAIHWKESGGGKANTATPNYAGAIGEMQVTKPTFETLKKNGYIPLESNFNNPADTLRAGVANIIYLSDRLSTTDPTKIGAAYYGGPGVVRADGTIREGIRDPRNPKAPTVGDYARSIAELAGQTRMDFSPLKREARDPSEDPTNPEYYTGKKNKDYTVEWNDGKKYTVTLPAGEDPNMAAYYVQKQYYPEASKQPQPQKETPGVGQTVRHAAIRSAAPTAGGFAGAALGAELGGAAGTAAIPIPGVGTAIGAGLGALAGGLGGGALLASAQEKILEAHPELAKMLGLDKETREAEEAANPNAAMLTEIGMNLVGARPTVSGLRALVGRTAAKDPAVAAKIIRDARIQSAIGGGTFAGIDLAQQLVGDQPYNPLQTLASLGVGALSQKETTIGRKLGELGAAPARAVLPEKYLRPRSVSAEDLLAATQEGQKPAAEQAATTAEQAVTTEEQKLSRKRKGAQPPNAAEILAATEGEPVAPPATPVVPGEVVKPVEPVVPGEDATPPTVETPVKPVEPIVPPEVAEPVESIEKSAEVKAAEKFVADVEAGKPLDPRKLRKVARGVGIEVTTNDDPLSIFKRVKDTVAAKPAEVVETTPAEVVETKPAEVVETKPAEVVETKPAEVVETKPAEVVETKPATATKPIEVPAEGSAQDRADLEAHIEKLQTEIELAHAEGDYEQVRFLEDEHAAAMAQLDKFSEEKTPSVKKTEPVVETKPVEEKVEPEVMRGAVEEPVKDLHTALKTGDLGKVLEHLSSDEKLSEPARELHKSLAKLLREGPSGYEQSRKAEPVKYGKVKLNVEGEAGHDAAAIASLKKRGKLAEYDPETNTIHVTKEGVSNEVVLHETVHAATVKNLKDFESEAKANFPERAKLKEKAKSGKEKDVDALQKYEDRMTASAHINNLFKEASERSVLGQPLRNKYPEAFKNVYEFVSYGMTNRAFQEDLAKVRVKKSVYTTGEMKYTHGKDGIVQSLWTEFTKALSQMFGLGRARGADTASARIKELEGKIAKASQKLEATQAEYHEAPEYERQDLADALDVQNDNLADLQETLDKAYSDYAKASSGKTQGNMLLELSQAVSDIIRSPTKVKGVEKLAATASAPAQGAAPTLKKAAKPKKPEPSVREIVKTAAERNKAKVDNQGLTRQLVASVGNMLGTSTRDTIKKLQNVSVFVKDKERAMQLAGKIIPGYNDAWVAKTLTPHDAAIEVTPYKNRLMDAVNKVAAHLKKPYDEAVAQLDTWAIARTEKPLREHHYLLNVGLNNDKKVYTVGKQKLTPADYRQLLVEAVDYAKTPEQAAAIKQRIREVVDKWKESSLTAFSPNPRIKSAGFPTDIKNPIYNVAGPYSHAKYEEIRQGLADAMKNPELKPLLDEYFDAMTEAHMQTRELGLKSGHWGSHVDNAIAFQDRGTTYAPLRGSAIDGTNYTTNPRMAGEKDTVQAAQEGRFSDSDSPTAQTLGGMDLALNRANRSPFVDRIYNLVKDGDVPGKILKPIKLNERTSDYVEKLSRKTQSKIVLKYRPDGMIDVIQVDSPEWMDAIRGVTANTGPWLSTLGEGTRLVAMGYTHYNPFFGPKNLVRDLLTNTTTVSADHGVGAGAEVTARALKGFLSFSPYKAARTSYLLTKGPEGRAKLAELAKNDEFYKNMYEYSGKGGVFSFKQAYSTGAEMKQLAEEMKGKPYASTTAIQTIMNVWNNMFELMNREAVYATIKRRKIADGVSSEQAVTDAAAYTKGLLNLEEGGKYGKVMGSWFALWKAQATGAVRTFESFRPIWQTAESALKDAESLGGKAFSETEKAKFIKNHNKQRMNASVTAMTAMGIGMFAYSRAKAIAPVDEDGNNKIAKDDKSQWVRAMRLPANAILGDDYEKILGKGNDFISIPWGYGGGAFAAMGAQMAMFLEGDIGFPEATLHMASAGLESFMPIPVASSDLAAKNPFAWAATSAAPTIARPFLEMAWNADEFGRQIYNNRMSKFGDAYTGSDYTSDIWKDAARHMQDKFGIDISPSTVQFFANNYAAGASTVLQGAYNQYLWAMGERDLDTRDLNPLRGFIARSSSYQAREFSEIEPKIKEISARIEALKNTENDADLDRLLDKYPNAESMAATYKRIKAHLNDVNAQMNKIEASNMLPREKIEEKEDLKLQRNMLMAQIVEMYNEDMN